MRYVISSTSMTIGIADPNCWHAMSLPFGPGSGDVSLALNAFL
jgi:hypothetical protein